MADHTPGTWTPDFSSTSKIRIYRGGFLIATITKLAHAWDEAVANARLIAAAPNLLSAIQDLLEVDPGVVVNYSGKDLDVFQRAREAVAAAKGVK